MSAVRHSAAGKTRACPHCKTTILDSAAVCPACRHHLRFSPTGDAATAATVSAFKIEGIIENPEPAERWEYTVVVAIRDTAGAELARQVVHVGALGPGERRVCAVSVDVCKPTVT